ncbi:ABC transporter ATP-binding protein [Macrococcus sp. TMW 2.2395]|nr:ABC transporter ATP-binding protein [Macrococcus sp. TMW 2.2395]MCU7557497.1 ABC transporter ATP-binding protein [Macrococcus sp. TMW 2.2395]
MSEIIVSQLTKSFHQQHVFQNISFSVNKGEIVGIIGASGSGKTTLIQCMLGILQPDHGTVTINNQFMPDLNALQHIGYMAQSDALYEDLTGLEHLKFFGRIYQLKKAELVRAIERVADITDLTPHLNKRVAGYSGGMKRRLSLAISLLHQPELIILDEPTVGIDPILKRKIWHAFNDLHAQGTTIIITTHIMEEAEACDKLLLLYNNTMIGFGAPDRLKAHYEVDTIEDIFIKVGETQ